MRKTSPYNSIIITVCIFLCSVGTIYAQNSPGLFAEGNQYYRNGHYEEALQTYLNIMQNGYESGALYYNIGNTYYKLQITGKAVLFYQRAKRLIPDDEDLNANIQILSLSVADKITPLPDVFYIRYWKQFCTMTTSAGWKAVLIAAWLAAALCAIGFFFTPYPGLRRITKIFFVTCIIITGISALVIYSHHQIETGSISGVIMPPEINVFSSPSNTGTELFKLHEGTLVELKRTSGDWIEIRIADGKVGWIRSTDVEKV